MDFSELKKTFSLGHNGLTMSESDIPAFFDAESLGASDLSSLDWYRINAGDYDANVALTFRSLGVDDEMLERTKIISELALKPGMTVLELGAGTGRDSVLLASSLGNSGELHVTDVHGGMLLSAKEKLDALNDPPRFFLAKVDAHSLPYPDDFFDRVFHFGGANTFSDLNAALWEWSRVCKPGGLVVFGDESFPKWMRDFELQRIVANSNPLFLHEVPLDCIPSTARDLTLRWLFNDGFYLISFRVDKEAPKGDVDFEIPGKRGGTLRNRYFGVLEGVDPQLKSALANFASLNGMSISATLEEMIRRGIERDANI